MAGLKTIDFLTVAIMEDHIVTVPRVVDFFFSPYPSAQERRLKAALGDGLAHNSCIEPHDPVPGKAVTLLFTANADKPVERVAVYYTTDGPEPCGEYGKPTSGAVVMAEAGEITYDSVAGMEVRHWRAVLPGQPDGTLVRYRADAWNAHDVQMHWYADSADPVTMPPSHGRIFAYSVDRWDTPAWLRDALIYHIFVDRFSTAHDEPPLWEVGEITDFLGGTLRGIIEKLDYIQKLGANCIWLSPVFESPTHHGYNPSDYYNVARRFGTNETLRQLIGHAHARGMRVILDFVANHTSDEHPSFVDAKSDPGSPTAHWYSFGDWPPHGYRSYALVRNMPELATEHPDVQRYLIDAALHWLGYFGADGLRLDYIPGPSHAFWTVFQGGIKQRYPQALTLGEITSPLPEVANYVGRIDAFMDFSLAKMLRRVFALREATLSDLLVFLDERVPLLPRGMGLATLLDNHDMHRFLWLAGGQTELLKLAATCHMTLEGTPIIYYGTEVGLSQYDDAHKENAYARAPMIWDQRQDITLLQHYRRLGELRKSHPSLRYGARINVEAQFIEAFAADVATSDIVPGAPADVNNREVGAYVRIHDDDFLLIVLNNGKQPVRVRIRLADLLVAKGVVIDSTMWLRDILAGMDGREFLLRDGCIALELEELSAVILEPF